MASLTRVVMFGSLPPLRGISAYCLDLARAVSRLANVEFVSFHAMYPRRLYPGGDPEDATQSSLDGEPFTTRRSLSWYNPFGWLREALRVRADVIHVQHWSLPLVPIWTTILLVAKLRGIRTVLTIHNTAPHERSFLYLPATRVLARLAGHCLVHSETNRRQAHERLRMPVEKVSVVRLGVHGADRKRPPDRAGARRKLGLPADAPTALFFGSIRPYKGVDVLLEAFARVVERLPRARLVIAGKPWRDWDAKQRLIEQLNLSECVACFPDYVPSTGVQDFFDAADVCLFPYTHFDAQSAAALTALAFEKPLIVSDVGGLPDLVGDRRFVVAPGDSAALAEAVIAALGDVEQLKRMAEDSIRVARLHSWEDIARQTVEVYLTRPGRADAEDSQALATSDRNK
jgi:glycosyltransferase involved in cell wall biosynthesis